MSSDHRTPHVGPHYGAAMRSFGVGLSLFVLLVALGCGGRSTNTNGTGGTGPVTASVSGTIAVGTAPSAIALDSTSNKIYVADFGTQPTPSGLSCSPTGADVAVIDGTTESPTATVAFPSALGALNPVAIALNPANHTVYVVARVWRSAKSTLCSWISDDVTAIDTSTLSTSLTYGKSTLGGLGFLGIDVNQATSDIYLSDAGTFPSGTNSVIVIGGNAATIPVGTKPIGISVNATTNKIYIANSGSNDVTVIDGSSNSVLATITDPNAVAPIAVAMNPATNTIYVANSQSNNVTVIDGATDSVTATISVGTSPSGVDVDSQTNFIYVANAGNAQAGDPGNITVINGATKATYPLTDQNAKNPVAVGVNPTTNKIYVANSGSNNVTVIDGAHD